MLGGPGDGSTPFAALLLTQILTVAATVARTAAGTAIALSAAKRVTSLRPAADQEREGLDIADHGERAYNW